VVRRRGDRRPEVLDFLNETAFRVLGEDASWAELLGFATGLACVWLVVRQHIANWPVGIVNVVLLMVAFWTAGLYGDAALQIVYVVLGFYGWWAWLRPNRADGPGSAHAHRADGPGSAREARADGPGPSQAGRRETGVTVGVRRTRAIEWVWLSVGGVAATAALYWLLATRLGSTVPLADAATTALSLVATYGQCRKLVENWWFWIAADIVYVPLYAYKHLYLTTVLYVVFLGLSVTGLVSWRRDLRAVETLEQAPVPA
jgi:nicotinamide mononucleotide transporter